MFRKGDMALIADIVFILNRPQRLKQALVLHVKLSLQEYCVGLEVPMVN